MGTAQGVNDYISISDFTPGIHGSYHSIVNEPETPNGVLDGAAQIGGTFGCYGRRGGGLYPLFQVKATRTQSMLTSVSGYTPTLGGGSSTINPIVRPSAPYNRQQVLATAIICGMDTGQPDFVQEEQDELLVLQSFLALISGTTYQRFYVLGAWHLFKGATTPVTYTCQYGYENDEYHSFGAAISTPLAKLNYGRGFLVPVNSTIINREPTSPLWQAPAFLMFTSGPEKSSGAVQVQTVNCHVFPGRHQKVGGGALVPYDDFQWNNVFSEINNVFSYSGSIDFAVYHQGRAAVSFVFYKRLGAVADQIMQTGASDFWHYSAVNEAANFAWQTVTGDNADVFYTTGTTPDWNTTKFGSLQSTNVGAALSMNANELLIVKRRGGGQVIRGDLASPTVVDMPSVPGVLNDPSIPVATPFGMVYGSTSGVWAWTGNDNAQLLSPQFDNAFWRHPDIETTDARQPRGKFNYAHPWLFAPNGYLYNFDTQSWWRIQDDDDTVPQPAWYELNDRDQMYAVSPYIDSGQSVLWRKYDLRSERADWQWTSQPLTRTRNRELQAREIVFNVQGTGTVTFTFINNGNATVVGSLQFTCVDPTTYRINAGHKMQDCQLRINMTSGGEPLPAPILHRVAIGYRETTSVIRAEND